MEKLIKKFLKHNIINSDDNIKLILYARAPDQEFSYSDKSHLNINENIQWTNGPWNDANGCFWRNDWKNDGTYHSTYNINKDKLRFIISIRKENKDNIFIMNKSSKKIFLTNIEGFKKLKKLLDLSINYIIEKYPHIAKKLISDDVA